MFRTPVTLLAASLSLVLFTGCKQEAAAPTNAGDAASGIQATVEQAEAAANAAGAVARGDAPLKPGERVQGTIQLDVGNGPVSFRSIATKVDDDLGKKTAERLASAEGQEDLAGAKAKVSGGANVTSQNIQETADLVAGRTFYTSQMYSLAIIDRRGIELAGIAADGRRVSLEFTLPMDSDIPNSAKLTYIPDGKKQMQSFVTDRDDTQSLQITLNRFERVDDHTLSIAGSFKADKLNPGVSAKDLAGQEIVGASGSFDFTEVNIRPEE